MSAFHNVAAWQPAPTEDLEIKEAPVVDLEDHEIRIKNEAICIQPLDARIRGKAYIKVPYPFILGNTVAGTIVEVGKNSGHFKVGDRVVSDTAAYTSQQTKFGAWQRFVVGDINYTVDIADAPFEDAIVLPFALQTAVAALNVYLGMEKPGERASTAPEEKVLIWGAGGAVGGYAVQYAKSVGYTVVATASTHSHQRLKSFGASQVFDYQSPNAVNDLRNLGPYKYLFTTSGGVDSQKAMALLLQPQGGKFASTLPLDVELPGNVERIYQTFGTATHKSGPEFESFARWWYDEYLGRAIVDKLVDPVAFEKRTGGLNAIQAAADEVLSGKTSKKIVLNPQD